MKYKISGMFRCIVNSNDRQHAELEVLKQLDCTEIYIIDVEEVEDEHISRVCNRVRNLISSSFEE